MPDYNILDPEIANEKYLRWECIDKRSPPSTLSKRIIEIGLLYQRKTSISDIAKHFKMTRTRVKSCIFFFQDAYEMFDVPEYIYEELKFHFSRQNKYGWPIIASIVTGQAGMKVEDVAFQKMLEKLNLTVIMDHTGVHNTLVIIPKVK